MCFSKPKTPSVPPTPSPAPIPTPVETSPMAAEDVRRQRIKQLRAGFASTIKTSPVGGVFQENKAQLKTKLGQ